MGLRHGIRGSHGPEDGCVLRQRDDRRRNKQWVVTFDDGYANNYERAACILGMSSTFFVTTGFVDGMTSPWTDTDDRLILGVPYQYSPWHLGGQRLSLSICRAVAILFPPRTPYRLIHPFCSLRGYARATAQQRFSLQWVEFYHFALLLRPFDVLLPRLTRATMRLATGLRHTALRLCGTGFVAVSIVVSSSVGEVP